MYVISRRNNSDLTPTRASAYYGSTRIGRVISVIQFDNGMVEVQLLRGGTLKNVWLNITQVMIKVGA